MPRPRLTPEQRKQARAGTQRRYQASHKGRQARYSANKTYRDRKRAELIQAKAETQERIEVRVLSDGTIQAL